MQHMPMHVMQPHPMHIQHMQIHPTHPHHLPGLPIGGPPQHPDATLHHVMTAPHPNFQLPPSKDLHFSPYQPPQNPPAKDMTGEAELKGRNGPVGTVVENNNTKGGSKPRKAQQRRVFWTEEEHRMFLVGLHKYGQGDCLGPAGAELISIFMGTRSPMQVRSHAQKYFLRLKKGHHA